MTSKRGDLDPRQKTIRSLGVRAGTFSFIFTDNSSNVMDIGDLDVLSQLVIKRHFPTFNLSSFGSFWPRVCTAANLSCYPLQDPTIRPA